MNPDMYQAMSVANMDPLARQQQMRGYAAPLDPAQQDQGQSQKGMGLFGGGLTSQQAAKMIMQTAMMAGGI